MPTAGRTESAAPPPARFRLAYKILILLAAVIILVMSVIVYFSVTEYKRGMYRELLERAAHNIRMAAEDIEEQAWTRAGRLREPLGTPKGAKLTYAVEKIFADIRAIDPTVRYFVLYYPLDRKLNTLAWPGIPASRAPTLIADYKSSIRRSRTFDARYNAEERTVEAFFPVTTPSGKVWGHLEMGVTTQPVRAGVARVISRGAETALICFALAIGLALVFSKIILVPVRRLSQAAHAVTSGNLDVRADINSRDEIAQLGHSFNLMTQSLQDRIQDMQAVQLLSTRISAQLSQEGLMHTLAQTFNQIAGSDHCAILERNEKQGTFEIASGIGVIDPQLTFDSSNGALGEVLTGGAPKQIDDLPTAPLGRMFYRESEPAPPGARGLILPIRESGATRAMIVLAGPGLRAGPSDLELFDTLCRHTAVMINNARLYTLATTDGLTGLYLRRHFMQQLSEIVSRQSASGESLALMMTDIDHFKKVNDTYGHPEGDFVLISVANTLKTALRTIDIQEAEREPDMVGRYGGEEFIVLLRDVTPDNARAVAERVRRTIEQSAYRGEKNEHHITVSIGLCMFSPGLAVEEWIERADKKLYESKQSGRNRVTMHENA